MIGVVVLVGVVAVVTAIVAVNISINRRLDHLDKQALIAEEVLRSNPDGFRGLSVRRIGTKGVVIEGEVDTQQDVDRLKALIHSGVDPLGLYFAVRVRPATVDAR